MNTQVLDLRREPQTEYTSIRLTMKLDNLTRNRQMSEDNLAKIRALTAQIVCAHLSITPTEVVKVSNLIRTVYTALANIDQGHTHDHSLGHHHDHALTPAVPIEESVSPDWIVCLEDGKKLKTLKRHLASSFNLTIDEYRAKWGLPVNYPMVAPNYAAWRSTLAKSVGLGRGVRAPAAVKKPAIRKDRATRGAPGKRPR
jgi:predicted transcriptional regulator